MIGAIQRYDAKADLWSVGTVLFEMITGRPPFMGDNHVHLLRNIKTKSLRMPEGIKVSQECVNLLKLLLNRNPSKRAGFLSFFESVDKFVALGCAGPHVVEGDRARPHSALDRRGEWAVCGGVALFAVAALLTSRCLPRRQRWAHPPTRSVVGEVMRATATDSEMWTY